MSKQFAETPFACCPGVKYLAGFIALVAMICIPFGCNPPAASTQTAQAESGFGELIDQFTEQYKTIDEGKADGSQEAVHVAMHRVSSTLQKLALGAADSGVAPDQIPELKSTVERLDEIYTELDEAQHGGASVSYDDFAKELGELVEKLTALKP